VFQKLVENQLGAKRSKCKFGVSQVEYLGHIISGNGVVTDPNKVKAMWDWPKPKIVKKLRGFLGVNWIL
jgi:hypothetical protein